MQAVEQAKETQRIQRIRDRYHREIPVISIDRARFYTEKWRETEGKGMNLSLRVALAMKHVYENMTHYVDADDRIAGYWTEDFLGVPIDIERGVYNKVLQSELDKIDMIRFRVKALMNTGSYLLSRGKFGEAYRNIRMSKESGPLPMDMGFNTMSAREVNRYAIDPADKRILKKELLPYWQGKTVVEVLERKMAESGLLEGDMRDFAAALPANTSRQTMMISTCSTISTYQGHVILDFESVVKKGLKAMRDEVRSETENARDLSPEQSDFLLSLETAIEGIMIYASRLADKIEEKLGEETDPAVRAELMELLEVCRNVPINPAATFREALQSAWTLKTAVELAHPMNLHCLGRMDQIFYPYYQNDIEGGKITREQALELLEELLLKLMSQNIRLESNILANFYQRYLGSTPVTIGGLKPDGTDGANELTYLFLDAAKRSKAVTNVSLRVHENTSDELFLKVAEVLYDGCSNLSVFNDDVDVEAMKKRGFALEDARDYAVMGCVEMLCPGKTPGMSANALLLCRLMDITMRNGDSQTLMGMVKGVGLKTGDPDKMESFEEFLDALATQAAHQVKILAQASNLKDDLFAEMLPAPYVSAFIQGCKESRKDATKGGAIYGLSGISFINSIANVVDSLIVIKKLIFDDEEYTFADFLAAIDANFKGHEELLEKIIAIQGKWGNGHAETDRLARDFTDRLFLETYKYKTSRGAPFVPYVISMTTHTIDGRVSIATPDGRRTATPFAASCNPFNVERNGVTGAMRSVAALDYTNVLGCAVNMKFHPSSIGREPDSRRKWIGLLRTYFKLGGAQLQPTVVSAETLRAAQADPDSFQDLMVKVGGYSAYFTELGREIQNEVISRTEHHLSG